MTLPSHDEHTRNTSAPDTCRQPAATRALDCRPAASHVVVAGLDLDRTAGAPGTRRPPPAGGPGERLNRPRVNPAA